MASSPGGTSPSLRLRRGLPADAEACGRICYDAFRAIAERHGFPPDFPSPADAVTTSGASSPTLGSTRSLPSRTAASSGATSWTSGPRSRGLARSPSTPGFRMPGSAGDSCWRRSARAGAATPGVRLLQSAYHNRSLSLYTMLGFNVREPVVTLQGAAIGAEVPGYTVRPAGEHDLEAGNRVCGAVHGHDRSGELLRCHQGGNARVVEHGGGSRATQRGSPSSPTRSARATRT